MAARHAFPSLDFTRLDLSRLRLPKIELPNVDLSNIERPSVDLPEMPTLDLRALPRPDVDTDRLLGLARDVAYVGIGLTVLAVQQSQVRRRDLQRRITDAVESATGRAA